jgi:hypothetical protein
MSQTGKKKIVIKPFRTQVQMDPNYAEKTWKLLRNAICEIHKHVSAHTHAQAPHAHASSHRHTYRTHQG